LISAGATPQTSPGELTALPKIPQLYLRGPTSKKSEVVEGCEGKGWGKRRSERDGEGQGNVRGRGGERREGRRGKGICRTNVKLLHCACCNGKIIFFVNFAWNSGARTLVGPLDYAYPAHPIATPLSS